MDVKGYRAIPVLAEDEKRFKGIIYKVDILERKCNEGLEDVCVKDIMEDKSAFIFEKDSFFEPFM